MLHPCICLDPPGLVVAEPIVTDGVEAVRIHHPGGGTRQVSLRTFGKEFRVCTPHERQLLTMTADEAAVNAIGEDALAVGDSPECEHVWFHLPHADYWCCEICGDERATRPPPEPRPGA